MAVNPELRKEWNITDEQYRQIEDINKWDGTVRQEYRKSPEYLKLVEEMEMQEDYLSQQNADKETKERKRLEFQEKIVAGEKKYETDALDNLLTAEQKRKMREFDLATMSSVVRSFPTPHSFEVLDLTDTQRQQMEAIKKEFEPEFEKALVDFAEGKQNQFRKIALAEQFKTKMFDVLTDEQWDRLQNLVDNPPEYIKAFRKKVEQNVAAAKKAGTSWSPSLDSWKPGDAIPEKYRQERKTRGNFPRQAN